MAEVVVPAQVLQQLVVVEVPVVAELAERVSSVAGVVRISVRSVTGQFLAVVPFTLMGEDLSLQQKSSCCFLMWYSSSSNLEKTVGSEQRRHSGSSRCGASPAHSSEGTRTLSSSSRQTAQYFWSHSTLILVEQR
ncbi:hypothetical protein EYF80_046037 [Liparis tanakae]|uniref:Uncharacterized protein n=1 Tax=Liparis tanakae TaxID=230148 RepID=A0A4Z2FRA1_9TELE|nr:hypothetical protein EYF80_046037 [Liparis tanakae]